MSWQITVTGNDNPNTEENEQAIADAAAAFVATLVSDGHTNVRATFGGQYVRRYNLNPPQEG